MARYSKFFASLIGIAAAVGGVAMDADAIIQGGALLSSLAVYWFPNGPKQ